MDDFNDIEEIGDEIYFRKEEDNERKAASSTTIQPLHEPNAVGISDYKTSTFNNQRIDVSSNNGDSNYSKFEDVTLTIRNGGQYVVMYPYALNSTTSTKTIDNLIKYPENSILTTPNTTTTTPSTTSTTTRTQPLSFPTQSPTTESTVYSKSNKF